MTKRIEQTQNVKMVQLALLLVDVKLWIFNHLDIYDRAPWLI